MSNKSPEIESQLLLQLSQGSQEAFASIFRIYQGKIFALAYHLTESQVYAEEIVQDVFLKIWIKHRSVTNIENFEAYLFVTARNHIYTYLKSIARQQIHREEIDTFIPTDRETPETILFYKEYASLITAALEQLPEQQRQAYRLSREEGNSREQIATQMGISPETVKVHLARAMRSIRAFLLSRMPLYLMSLLLNLLSKKF